MSWTTMPRCRTWKEKHLGFLMKTLVLFGTSDISHVKGQIVSLAAPAFGSSPSRDVYVTYFGDTQRTSAIGADRTLPHCQSPIFGLSNLILRLENSNTGKVLQQVGPSTDQTGFLWDTTAIAALIPSLSGSYVCRLYQNSILVATSTLSYQLNVVVPMSITCTFPASLNMFSMNTLACKVTGYPQPNVSWSGINQTNPVSRTTLGDGSTSITSTVTFEVNDIASAFEGYELASDAGDYVTISFTAQFPTFSCTSFQNPSAQINLCDAIPKSVTYSRTLQVVVPVDRCPAFTDASWSPSTSNMSDYQTIINISCAPGYIGSSPISVFCQANGSWTTFPNCDAIISTSSPTTLGVWVIPVAAVAGVLLLLLIVMFLGCYLKRKSSPPPGKPPQADHTLNAVYEDATMCPNAMTESSAYELTSVPNQPNYEFIQPTHATQYDYVTPR